MLPFDYIATTICVVALDIVSIMFVCIFKHLKNADKPIKTIHNKSIGHLFMYLAGYSKDEINQTRADVSIKDVLQGEVSTSHLKGTKRPKV